jgi:hypothetical protein
VTSPRRNAYVLPVVCLTREEAEAAIARFELEDEEAEREAREQDADEEFGARADYEFERNR